MGIFFRHEHVQIQAAGAAADIDRVADQSIKLRFYQSVLQIHILFAVSTYSMLQIGIADLKLQMT